jgi:hypothetical protein
VDVGWWAARTLHTPLGVGELPAGLSVSGREAMVKVYGVAVAMPQGYSWMPPSSTEQQ